MHILKGLGAAAVGVLALAACAAPSGQLPATGTLAGTIETTGITARAVQPTTTVTTVAGTAATAPAMVMTAANAQLGTILVDANGMTLYRFANDQPDMSNCYDQCAQNWPPLLTIGTPMLQSGVTGSVGMTMRRDGSMQVTYNGMPLYYFAKDSAPGDALGQNVNGAWFVIQPSGSMMPEPTTMPFTDEM